MNVPTPSISGTGRPDPTLAMRVEENRDHGGTGLPVALAIQFVSEVAAELDRLHEAGRAHGDVQASQIAMPPRGPARLREPALDAPFSAASVGGDVTGLVAAAYLAICGVMPSYFHPLSSLTDEAASRASSSVLVSPSLHRIDLSPPVAEVLTKGLSPLVANRYATAGAFATALREAAGSAPPLAVASTNGRRRFLLPAALAACAALGAGAWLGTRHQRPTPRVVSLTVPSVASSSPSPAPSLTPAVPQADETAATPSRAETQKLPLSVASKVPTAPLPPTPSPTFGVGTPSTPSADTVSPPPRVREKRQTAVPNTGIHPSSFGFLRIYARQFLSAGDVLHHRISLVRAGRVLVDGSPSRSLAAGHWARLAPGKHRLAFYPVAGVPFDPNTAFWISLRPRRRQSFQVPLPRHPGGVQGFVAKKHPVSPV